MFQSLKSLLNRTPVYSEHKSLVCRRFNLDKFYSTAQLNFTESLYYDFWKEIYILKKQIWNDEIKGKACVISKQYAMTLLSSVGNIKKYIYFPTPS